MNSKDLIALLSENYNEPLVRPDNQPNLKLKFIKNWLDKEFGNIDLSDIAEKIIKNFVPTSVNPCPLIPHIKAILDQGQDTELDLAREIADRIINAVGTIGYTHPDRAKKYIGDIGWEMLSENYGGYIRFSQELLSDKVEITRAHLRDSAILALKRNARGEPISAPVNRGIDLIKRIAVTKSIKEIG